jgi:hypothetical protein
MENNKDFLRIDCIQPVFAGYYKIGDSSGSMNIFLGNKPKWIHRKFCNLLLGWRWIDSKKED